MEAETKAPIFAECSRSHHPEVQAERSDRAVRFQLHCVSHLDVQSPFKLSTSTIMSVLCYNKGCGQRFDPESNPDGKSEF